MTLRALSAETLLRPGASRIWRWASCRAGPRAALALPVEADGRFLDLASLYPGLREGAGLGAAYDLIATPDAYGAFLERLIAASQAKSETRGIREGS